MVLALALAAGCVSYGPTTISQDRFDYGTEIGDSWERHTLINLVRLRYYEMPIFIDVGQKGIFSFLMLLFTLADTSEKQALPLITIPADDLATGAQVL